MFSINSEAQIWICHLPGLSKGGDVVNWLKSQEELAEWDGFEPIHPEVAEYLKMRLLSLIEEHKQPYQSILQKDHNQEIEPESSENCLSQVPAFPSDAWPPVIWEWCQECAESMRIPPDFCCATLLVVLASLIGRKRQIRPEKKFYNYRKWLINLFSALFLFVSK